MPAPKGSRPPNAGKGRPKGATNTMTRSLREMILGALDKAGGQDYLTAQAHKNPAAFLALVGRVLPREPPAPEPPPVITLNFGTTLKPRQPPIEDPERSIEHVIVSPAEPPAPKLLQSSRQD
jgi:hypothetical protein